MSDNQTSTADLSEPMVFDDVRRIEVPVTIEGIKYVLKEADGGTGSAFRNSLLQCASISQKDGTVTVGRDGVLADSEAELVSKCLFRIIGDEENPRHQPVDIRTIKKWPDRVLTALAKRAKQISGLLEEGDEKEEKGDDSDPDKEESQSLQENSGPTTELEDTKPG